MKDKLFLLPAGFFDNGRREFCPECAEVYGLLALFPTIRDSIDISFEPVEHPRPGLTGLLGQGQWNCPTLVLGADAPIFEGAPFETSNGHRYFGSATAIALYYAERFGTPYPRGS